MAFDGVMLRACAQEIAAAATGARVERVFQPEPLVVTLHLYRRGEEATLLVSCHPRFYRVHLTGRSLAHPRSPSAFCMLLRKHLEGRLVTSVRQEGLERVLRLSIGPDRDGGLTLVAELMGKHSNLILLSDRPPAPVILDALKRIPPSLSRHRQVLPGTPYLPPPAREQVPLTAFTDQPGPARTSLAARWQAGEGLPAWRRLLEAVGGLGPDLAREALLEAGLDPEAPGPAALDDGSGALAALCAVLAELGGAAASGRFRPTRAGGAFAALPLPALASARAVAQEPFASAGALLDAVYTPLEEAERTREERQRLAQVVAAHLARARSRLAAQEEERRAATDAHAYRVMGELLMSQLHLVRPGQTSVVVTDYYDPALGTRTIPLDPRLTPSANAQAYFKKYARGRRALAVIEENLARTREEIAYLESVEAALDLAAGRDDLAEVAAELRETGYLREGAGDRQRPRREARAGRVGPAGARPVAPAGAPLTCVSSDGYPLLVGRNNRQNDHLTFRLAAPDDLWLHAREIPGAHVVVRLTAPAPPPAGVPARAGPRRRTPPASLDDLPRRTLEEAALLAAYFSKARRSANVPVDYTFRRHVRKPRGARPGMVVYSDHRTLFVTPDETAVARLLAAAPPAP